MSTTFTGLNNCQNNYFKTFKIGVSGSAVGLHIGGDLTGSGMATSFCRFSDARIIHQNNTAVVVYKADDCFFDNVVTTRATGGTGRAVVLNGVANGHAYGLWFKGLHVGLGEGVTHHWVFAGVYTAGSYIQVGRNLYQTTAGGTAGSTKPVHTSGSVSDGGVTWTYINPSASVISSNFGTSAAHNYLEIAGIDTNVEVLEDAGTEMFYYYTGRQTNGALNQDRSKPRVKSPPLGFSNVETIDRTTIAWYESLFSWTPTLTFATPGNLSVGYSTREASYTRIGHQITINWEIETSSFTHTTASGNLQITGVPFNTLKTAIGSVEIQGVSKANYTSFTSRITTGAAAVNVFASRPDGFGISAVSAADMPTGGNVVIRGTLTYTV